MSENWFKSTIILIVSAIRLIYASFDFSRPLRNGNEGGGEGGTWIKCRQHVVCGGLPWLYILQMRTHNCWWFVVVPLHVIWGPSSRVVTRVIMRRRIRGDVIRRAVILKLPDDHKTGPIGIYHLGAYYRRVNPRGWKHRANEPEAQW